MISFEELEGSPRIGIREDGTVAVRTFRVAWNDWPRLAQVLAGSYRRIGGRFQIVEPLAFPGQPNLMVSDIDVEPLLPSTLDGSQVRTPAAGLNRYPSGGARLTATYRTAFDRHSRPRGQMPSVPRGTYLTFRADLGMEYVAMPSRVWRWSAAGDDATLPPDVQPGVALPQGLLELTWHRVPLPPWDAMRQLRGAINATEFLGAPAGTVLFLGARARRVFQFVTDGGFWRITYQFQESVKTLSTGAAVGWNYFYREQAAAGEHWAAIEDQDGNPPYREADFAPLFEFGAF